MKRQNIILGNYVYVIDLYKADYSILYDSEVDIKYTPIYKKFKILKKFNILNDIIYDTDIYFIPDEENIDNVIYPIPNKTAIGYSKNMYHFNPDLNSDNLEYNTFHLYNSSLEEVSLLCDKVRIYLPSIKPDKTCIVDIENYINDIKFHYLVKDLQNVETVTNKEIKIDHNTYCEYIDIYIPNVENLISNENIYILEYNNVKGIDGVKVSEEKVYVPFNTLYKKFIIQDSTKIYKKDIYVPIKSSVKTDNINIYTYDKEVEEPLVEKELKPFYDNDFKSFLYNTLNVILYPYEGINNEGIYVIKTNTSYNSDIFTSDITFSLKSEIKFPKPSEVEEDFDKVKGVPCLFCTFKYPKLSGDMTLEDSYLYFNDIKKEDYDSIDLEELSDELDIEDTIQKTGYFIEIASDNKFRDIVYKYSILLDDEESIIDNLIFPLNNIFASWNNYPELLCIRATFIDRLSSNIIESNPIVIDRELYKYLVGEKLDNRIDFSKIYYNDKNNNTISTEMADYINGQDIKIDGFNFIDKINCNVVDKELSTSSSTTINKVSSSKVLYKPIFYKVADLQNIRIKTGVKQNIGINLSDVMTKVETFKLIIDSIEYVEYGRNDIYVLFNINAALLNSTSGNYAILNQDDEFISDGTWYLY